MEESQEFKRPVKSNASLLNLMLVMAIVSLGLALFVSIRNQQKASKENEELKYELGFLEIENPNKVYVRQLDRPGMNSWTYRIQWPKDYRGKYMVGKTKLKNDGRPDLANVSFQNGTFASHDVEGDMGQHEVVFSFLKNGDNWHFSETSVVPGNFPIQSDSAPLPSLSFSTYFAENVVGPNLAPWPLNLTPDFPIMSPIYGGDRHGAVVEFEANETIVFYQSKGTVIKPLDEKDKERLEAIAPTEVFVIAFMPTPNSDRE
jgi:hypothetical protein